MRNNEKKIEIMLNNFFDDFCFIDYHTHLFPIHNSGNNRFDELLTYHPIISELFSRTNVEPKFFYSLDLPSQANFIWSNLFMNSVPFSTHTKGILTILKKLDIPYTEDISVIRKEFDYLSLDYLDYEEKIFSLSNVNKVFMTNNPLDISERKIWSDLKLRHRYVSSLRLDDLISDHTNFKNQRIIAKFDNDDYILYLNSVLIETYKKLNYKYISVTSSNLGLKRKLDILNGIICPFCRNNGIPIVLMLGVKRGYNTDYLLAGDSLGDTDLNLIDGLLSSNRDIEFYLSGLSKSDQYKMIVYQKTNQNLKNFGTWWHLDIPYLRNEILESRIQSLGLNFVPYFSDARYHEQLLYKWPNFKNDIILILKNNLLRYTDAKSIINESTLNESLLKFFTIME